MIHTSHVLHFLTSQPRPVDTQARTTERNFHQRLRLVKTRAVAIGTAEYNFHVQLRLVKTRAVATAMFPSLIKIRLILLD